MFTISMGQYEKIFFDSFVNLTEHIDPTFYATFCERKRSMESLKQQLQQELERADTEEKKTKTLESYTQAVKKLPVVQTSNAVFLFRTFGVDRERIIEKLGECYEVKSTRKKGEEPKMMYKTEKGEEIDLTMDRFNEFLNIVDRPVIVQEDYDFWVLNEKAAECGKFVKGCKNTYHFAFDDNPCFHYEGENIFFTKVNSYRACTDENFFLDIIVNILEAKMKEIYPGLVL